MDPCEFQRGEAEITMITPAVRGFALKTEGNRKEINAVTKLPQLRFRTSNIRPHKFSLFEAVVLILSNISHQFMHWI